jgi:hypothetical protein
MPSFDFKTKYRIPNRLIPWPKRRSKPRAAKNEETGFLKSVISAFALVTAWVFVVGWTYLHTYYLDFGINADSLGFPIYRYFVLTFTQFVTLQRYGLETGVMLVLFFFATWMGMQTRSKVAAMIISFSYLLLFWAGFHFTVQDAKAEARRDMGLCSTRPQLMVEMPNVGQIKYDWASDAIRSSYDLRLLAETNDQIFAFVPINTDTTQPTYQVKVLAIDKHELLATTRIVTLTNREEPIPCKQQK